MNNLFSKSANRLLEKSSIHLPTLERQLGMLLTEQRKQRGDLQTINNKLDRIMVDKHLQMQVDEYFNDEDSPNNIPDSGDLD